MPETSSDLSQSHVSTSNLAMAATSPEMTEEKALECPGGSAASVLQQLCAQTFRTRDGKAFLRFNAGRGDKIVPIQSKQFRRLLASKLQEATGKQPSPADLKSAIESVEDHAQSAQVAEVYVRVASAGGRVYIDLADDSGRIVEIGPDGWKVTDTAPVHFLRPANIMPLPVPEKGGTIDELRSLINVADESDFDLIVGWTLYALCNRGAHPILVVNGGEGTAKSTLSEFLRGLVDPSTAQPSGLPQTERQLKADESYLCVFDNVSSIPPKMADALCRVSDSGHPIIMNGIDDLVTRADLADRCLFANLALVTDRQRRSQQEIRGAFETVRPKILAVLFDAVAHGLRTLPTTRLDALPRMADFARWATACEGALWPPGRFMDAYNCNRTEAAEQLIETDPVASAVQRLANSRPVWTGTAAKLLTALGFVKHPAAPQSPRALRGQLARVAPRLCKAGIDVEFRRTGHSHERTIIISLRPREDGGEHQRSSAPSAPSARCGEAGEQHDTAAPAPSETAAPPGNDGDDVATVVSPQPECNGHGPMTSAEEPSHMATAQVPDLKVHADGADRADGPNDATKKAPPADRADEKTDSDGSSSGRLVDGRLVPHNKRIIETKTVHPMRPPEWKRK